MGGMGYVVAATHLQLGKRVALKFLHAHRRDPRDVERFLREARAAAVLRSEHVAQVLDVGTDADEPFIVLEYLEGVDLRELHRREGPLPPDRAASLAMQASLGVAEAHDAGIVHRDLKPTNLFATTGADGTTIVKVLDFGISKWRSDPALQSSNASAESLTEDGQIVGSPNYMSPEQITSARNVDARTDVWSLGVVLYELLTGRLPFAAESPSEWIRKILTEAPLSPAHVRPDLPLELSVLVMRCLTKDPALRFADARELAQALRPFTETGAEAAGGSAAMSVPTATLDGATTPQAPGASARRWTRLAIVSGVGVAAIGLAAVGISLVHARRSSPSTGASLAAPSVLPSAQAAEGVSATGLAASPPGPSSPPTTPSGLPFAPATTHELPNRRPPATSPVRRPAGPGEERLYEHRQ